MKNRTISIRKNKGELFHLEKAPEEAPHIIEKPAHSLKVDEGEPLAFQIRVTGYPEPTFSIVKDRVKRDPFSPDFGNPDFERPTVEKLGVGSYQIYFPHGVFKEDNGWYTCGARNAIGSDTFSFKLNVNGMFFVTRHFIIKNFNSIPRISFDVILIIYVFNLLKSLQCQRHEKSLYIPRDIIFVRLYCFFYHLDKSSVVLKFCLSTYLV